MEETKEKKVTVKPDKGQKETTTEKKISKTWEAVIRWNGCVKVNDPALLK